MIKSIKVNGHSGKVKRPESCLSNDYYPENQTHFQYDLFLLIDRGTEIGARIGEWHHKTRAA